MDHEYMEIDYMECDDITPINEINSTKIQNNTYSRCVIVFDTNILLHDLAFFKKVVNESEKKNIRIVLPWAVVDELDGLKVIIFFYLEFFKSQF